MADLQSIFSSKPRALLFSVLAVGAPMGDILLWVFGGVPLIVEAQVVIFIFGLTLGYGWGHLMWWFFNGRG
ncbi:MAG TPA: hypothetical protein VLE94_01520 [Burkholderiaceae bacterium]|nr:hypothetical protein [Burkholderiaceae bacterium]